MAEMEEFLPHGAEKKQTHFTDVSNSMGTVVGWDGASSQCDRCIPSLLCPVNSLKGRRLLGCPSSI